MPAQLLLATALSASLPMQATTDDEAALQRSLVANRWALAIGAVALASVADGRIDRQVLEHDLARRTRVLRGVGDAAPFLAFGLASWQSWNGTDGLGAPQPVHRAATWAGVEAIALGQGMKLATHRARPEAGLGPEAFGAGSAMNSSFPSVHTSLAWAVATPYALHYRSNWPFALASVTNASRVLGRKHWLSDTVAGSFAGYWIGRLNYERTLRSGSPPRVTMWAAPGQLWLHAAW